MEISGAINSHINKNNQVRASNKKKSAKWWNSTKKVVGMIIQVIKMFDYFLCVGGVIGLSQF